MRKMRKNHLFHAVTSKGVAFLGSCPLMNMGTVFCHLLTMSSQTDQGFMLPSVLRSFEAS